MANDKDFILKNAVEVGGPTNVTLGTITSSDIDLSTGNYFSDTLAANTTYTISNAGDVQSFQVEVTGGTSNDISLLTYDNVTFSVASQDTAPRDITFNDDGTKMYIAGAANDNIYQYSLTTAYDISTASYDSVSFSQLSQESSVQDVEFKPDGTKMYIIGGGTDTVFQYSLSTAWDLSTASYDSVSFSTNSVDTLPTGMVFKPDGTKMYLTGQASDNVYSYTMSTAWDVSTLSYDSVFLYVGGEETSPTDLHFSSDGIKLYVLGNGTDVIHSYTLSTAWDISTATSDSSSFSVDAQEGAMQGMFFTPEKVITVGSGIDQVYSYSLSSATITWPSSIEWAGGIAPAAPLVGETDLFTITTDDGGTTYTGVKTADNLS